MKSDIAIIGGGIIGCAAAYFLATKGADSVTVIEPDATYAKASTPAGAGGVRRLMSRPENIRMSQFSLDFFADFAETMATDDNPADIAFRRQGYLFLTNADGVDALTLNFETQAAEGVPAELLDVDALRARFPSIGTDNVAMACHSPEDGWIDPHAALMGFRKKAQNLGVEFLKDKVISLDVSPTAVTGAGLESGQRLEAECFINVAGAWVSEIAAMTGAKLPVVPMCRVQHFWHCAHDIEPLPLVKDDSGAFFRPEGDGFAGGRPSWEIEPGFNWDVDRGYFATYFEDTVWELLANMVPKFETIKLERTWAGHYAQNMLDGNMIIGRYSDGHENLLTACGFSGHGIMHAPAVGRALSELVLHGRYETIDLTQMEFDRVLRNEPYAEIGIK
ncbi:MAG: FAD-binding oxidoreductase [Hyphomicrobiaceae bacterium]|nr:FAD-binding oxidoreductase [Hyphomicrobiaceae bacterium]